LAQVEQDLAQEFNLVPAIAREYADLQRELEAATQSLNRFVETRETLKIDAAQTSAPWELISAPQTESKPVAYHLLRNAGLGALLGLLLGLVAAAVMEKLDQVFHSTEDLKSMAPPPVVGTIPYVRDLHKRGLVGATSADSPSLEYMLLLEAFRSLYTSIRFLDSDASVGSMVVTSTIPGEGKSTIAAGLAQAAAAVGQRVLLVDADLRTPQQHLRADLSNHQGLTNLTSEAADPSTVVQRTADPNLFVLTAGPRPADAGRVLASQQMQAVMQQLHQAFDVVIYDTPPASGFADSSLLAARVDRLILTVGLGKTDRALVERCLEKLRFSSTTAMVMVANGIKPYTTPMQRYAGYQHYYQPSEPSAPPPEDAGSTPSLSSRPISPTARDSASTPEADPGLPARSSAPNSGPARPSAATASSAPPALKSAAVLRRYQLGWKPTAVMIGGMLLLGAGSFLAIAWLTQRQGEPDVTAASDRPDAPSESNAETADADTAASGDAAIADEPAPFERAVQIAEAAVTTGGSAQTPPEWSQTAELWQQASALMAMVPETDARFEVARDRVIEYRSNSEYARQRALFLQLEAR
ncbi:MAG: polysaccharide biosynthesis tyrosine autokinase, partial [Cyanobacteria bacterium P01_A01_bin.135]